MGHPDATLRRMLLRDEQGACLFRTAASRNRFAGNSGSDRAESAAWPSQDQSGPRSREPTAHEREHVLIAVSTQIRV